jgi:hypothetical protein
LKYFAIELKDSQNVAADLANLGYSLYAPCRIQFGMLYVDDDQIHAEDYVYLQLKYNIVFPTGPTFWTAMSHVFTTM